MRKKNFRKGVSLGTGSLHVGPLCHSSGRSGRRRKEAQGGKNDVPTYTIATVRWTDASGLRISLKKVVL